MRNLPLVTGFVEVRYGSAAQTAGFCGWGRPGGARARGFPRAPGSWHRAAEGRVGCVRARAGGTVARPRVDPPSRAKATYRRVGMSIPHRHPAEQKAVSDAPALP